MAGPILLNLNKRKRDAAEVLELTASKQPRLNKLLSKMEKISGTMERALNSSKAG